MGIVDELLVWLNREDVPAMAWQQASLLPEIENRIRHIVHQAVKKPTPQKAVNELTEALRWAYMRRAVIARMNNRRPQFAFRFEVLHAFFLQWAGSSVEERENTLYQILVAPTSWKPDEISFEQSLEALHQRMTSLLQRLGAPKASKRKGLRIVLGIMGMLSMLGGGLLVGFIFGRSQAGSPQVSPSPLGPTQMSIPTRTPPPTPTFTPSPQPPTPTPTSQFQQAPLSWAIPPLPNTGREILFLIDDEYAQLHPQTGWGRSAGGVGHRHQYWNQAPTGTPSPVYAQWDLDIPLPQDGLYEIYVLDPDAYGGSTNTTVTYSVLVDNQPVQPVVGSSTLRQFTQREQEEDRWRSIGIYSLPKGARLSVRLDLTHFPGSPTQIAGVDALLITRLQLPDEQRCPPLSRIQGQAGFPVYWKEVQAGKRKPVDAEIWTVLPSDSLVGCGPTWVGNQQGAKVTWTFAYVIPGTYRLCAWVPVWNQEAYASVLSWKVSPQPPKQAQWTFDPHMPKPGYNTITLPVEDFNQLVCLGTLEVFQEPVAVTVEVQGDTPPVIANAVFLTISWP